MKKRAFFPYLPTKKITAICKLTKRVKGKVTRVCVCVGEDLSE